MSSFIRALCASALVVATLAVGCRCVADVQAVAIASPPSSTVSVSVPSNFPYFASNDEIYADLSDTGRFVVFQSRARNVLPGIVPPSRVNHVYLFDRATAQTTLVSHGPAPSEFGNAESFGARISGDGSTVLFRSHASNLGGPGLGDVATYLFERQTGNIRFLGGAVGSGRGVDMEEPLSHDGSWAAFVDLGGLQLYERATGSRQTVPVATGCTVASWGVSYYLSADGRRVAFTQHCEGQEWDAAATFDRVSGQVTQIRERAEAIGLSRDGRFVLLRGRTESGWQLFRYDCETGQMVLASVETPGNVSSSYRGRLSDDGSVVVFSREPVSGFDYGLFAYEFGTGSVRPLGARTSDHTPWTRHMSMSGDGRSVAYLSTTQRDIVVVDRLAETWRVVTTTGFPGIETNGIYAFLPRFSRDGSLVVFASDADSLGVGLQSLPGGGLESWSLSPALYGVEIPSDRVVALSLAGEPNRVQPVAPHPFLSSDGRKVAFQTYRNTQCEPQTPWLGTGLPAFVLDRESGITNRVEPGPGPYTELLGLSGDGSIVLEQGYFETVAVRSATGETWRLPIRGKWTASASRNGTFALSAESLGGGPAGQGAWLWEPASGLVQRVSRSSVTGGEANGTSRGAAISEEGGVVAFSSDARDLIPGMAFPANASNVFLYDRSTDVIRLVSSAASTVPADGRSLLARAPNARVLSGDGRYLVLTTTSRNIGGLALPAGQHLVLFDRVLGTHTLVSGSAVDGLDNARNPSMDSAGRFVVFERYGTSGQNTLSAAFLFDRLGGGQPERLFPAVPGVVPHEEDVLISGDGSTIALHSRRDLAGGAGPVSIGQAYVLDRQSRRVLLASHSASPDERGNDVSRVTALDATGDTLLFRSAATNLGVNLGYTGVNTGVGYAAFLYTPPPLVYGVSPSCASTTGGRTVTIEGAHFKPGSTVTLDGIPATVTNVTSTALTVVTGARAPTAARTGNVEVRSPDGEYFALGNAFTYAIRGDANNSGALTAADGFYLNMALFLGGPQPATLCNGDANGSGATTSADAFFLNLYLFLGGAPPPP
ncbi:MAG: IPT/TIG domain-containing protein [Acidobacteria bacterium]|nr:IPT/TIG domain-containing protein [Acidobacteriota bacterium]